MKGIHRKDAGSVRQLPPATNPQGPAGWFTLFALLAAACASTWFPYHYFFDETVMMTGLFLMLLLVLHGPVACISGALLAYGSTWLLVAPDPLFLAHVLKFAIVSWLYLMFKRRLVLAQAVFSLVLALPPFLFLLMLGAIQDPKGLSLVVTKELVHAQFEALAVEAFVEIGLPLLRQAWARRKASRSVASDNPNQQNRPHAMRVRVRSVLIYATFGPLMLCTELLFIFAGISSMQEIVGKARALTDGMASGIRREVDGWTIAERRSLALDGVIEAARLEDAFQYLSDGMPSQMVLFRQDGAEQLRFDGGAETLRVDWALASAIDLGQGLRLLTQTPLSTSLERAWSSGIFVQAFTLERQTVVVALPLRQVDDILNLQYQMLTTAGPFLMLALGLLLLVSRLLERSLNHLAEGTTGLLAALGGGQHMEIPSSGIMELDALADNFRFMNGTLDELFQELQAANEDLQAQSERLRRSEAELFRLAHFDVLTQLPNRFYLRKTLKDLIDAHQPFALMLIDLDRFKPINDLYGHHVGDLVLQEVGEAFRAVIGDSVETGRFACRLGGDEFVTVVAEAPDAPTHDGSQASDTPSRDMVRNLAQCLIDRISAPIHVAGLTVQVLASIGISRFPKDGIDAGVLLKQADQAMYRAKQQGGNAFAEGGMPDA